MMVTESYCSHLQNDEKCTLIIYTPCSTAAQSAAGLVHFRSTESKSRLFEVLLTPADQVAGHFPRMHTPSLFRKLYNFVQ